MTEFLLMFVLVLVFISIIFQIVSVRRKDRVGSSPLEGSLQAVERTYERTERTVRDEIGKNRKELLSAARDGRMEMNGSLKSIGETLHQRLNALTLSNDEKLEKIRGAVEKQLTSLQTDNNKSLEEMRKTVDEKLQGTLEKRLGASFKLISDRLEKVHRRRVLGNIPRLILSRWGGIH